MNKQDQQLEGYSFGRSRTDAERDVLFNLSDDLFCMASFEGVFLKVNPAWSRTLGWSLDELVSRPSIEFVHPDDREATMLIRSGLVVSSQAVRDFENRYLCKDGTFRWLSWRTQALPESRQVFGVARDITEKKCAENALRESEQRYRLLFENNPHPMWLYELGTLRFLEVNDAAIALYGYTREEFLTMTLEQIRPEEDIPALRISASNKSPGVRSSGIWRHRLKGGAIIFADISSHMINVGSHSAVLVLIQNVTEKLKAHENLQESEKRFRSVFEQAAVGICIVAPDKSFLRVNPAFCKMLEYTADELIQGHTCIDTTHQDDLESDANSVERLLLGAPSVVFEKRYLSKFGQPVPARVTLSMHHAEGKPRHFVAIVENLSEVRKAEVEKEKLVRLMKSLLVSVGEGIFGLDTDGCCTFINPAGAAILGYSIHEILSRDIHVLIHHHRENGESYSRDESPILQAYTRGESCRIENEVFWKSDGTSVPVAYVAQPIIENGICTGAVVAFSDVSDRKRFEERLIEQAALLDIARDAILVKDLDHKIIFWNKGAEEIYGWSKTEALGRRANELLQHDEVRYTEANRRLVIHDEWNGELLEKTKDNRFITVDVRSTLVRDKEGRPKSILAIKSDITQKKKLEEQLMRAQRMDSIGTLAGGMAHDLNNVLTPILVATELLRDKLTDAESLDLLCTMEDSARHGAELIKQVLVFARGVGGQRVKVDVGSVIGAVQNIVRDTFPKNIVLDVEPLENAWLVEGDPTQLHQVLLNLCVNARDAMADGGRIKITVEPFIVNQALAAMNLEVRPGPFLAIRVSDNGAGMTPQVIEKIFDPFFTTKEVGKGTGLGLSTSLAIVKSHGGFFNIESTPGLGSEFTIFLPSNDTAPCSLTSGKGSVPSRRGDGETILLVDDQDAVRNTVQRTLQKHGYNVIPAESGTRAIALFTSAQHKISLVITDISMPEMDGRQLIAALKEIDPSVLVIASSGVELPGALQNDPDHIQFLQKPYSVEALLDTLQRMLQTRTGKG